MSIISISQAIAYAQTAGFSGDNLARIVAIAMCESNLNTHPVDNTAGNTAGRDRGILQFNSYYHSEVSDSCAYDALCSFQNAYRVTKGNDFHEWSTFTNGCSDGKMSTVRSSMSSVNNPSTSSTAWYTFPRIDNIGGIEPFGGFPKPDSNIQIPANYPVTALLSGKVTALDSGLVAWGAVVTIRLDNQLNTLATHTAYLHLAKTTVNVGQHVNAGDLIGYNGGSAAAGSQKVPLGFALYPGDHYGFGNEWGLMTKSNLLGQLNPVPILNQAKSGSLVIGNGPGTDFTPSNGTSPMSVVTNALTSTSTQAYLIINNVPGFSGIVEALDKMEQFTPFTLSTQANQDLTSINSNTDIQLWNWDSGIPNPFTVANQINSAIQLPADAMQAILVFTTTNFAAFLVRTLFVSADSMLTSCSH